MYRFVPNQLVVFSKTGLRHLPVGAPRDATYTVKSTRPSQNPEQSRHHQTVVVAGPDGQALRPLSGIYFQPAPPAPRG